MSLVLDGTNGLTFNNASTQASAGVVLQVVQGSYSTQATNSTSSYAATGLSASITPKFSTSKILVLFSIPSNINRQSNGGIQGFFQLLRNSTAVYTNTQGIGGQAGTGNSGGVNLVSVVNGIYLDSPATTSSTSYSVSNAIAFSESGYLIYSQYGSNPSTITLMEIAG